MSPSVFLGPELLAHEANDNEGRISAVRALTPLAPDARAQAGGVLLSLLDDPNPWVAENAMATIQVTAAERGPGPTRAPAFCHWPPSGLDARY